MLPAVPVTEPVPEPISVPEPVRTEPLINQQKTFPRDYSTLDKFPREYPNLDSLGLAASVSAADNDKMMDVETAYRLIRARFDRTGAAKFDELWRTTAPELMKRQIVVSQKHGNLWVERHQDGSVTVRPDQSATAQVEGLQAQLELARQARDKALSEFGALRARIAGLLGQ